MASTKRSKSRRPKNELIPVATYSSFECNPNAMGVSWDPSANSGHQTSLSPLPMAEPVMTSPNETSKDIDNQGQKSTQFLVPPIREDFVPTSYLFSGLIFSNMNIIAEFIRLYFHYVTPWVKSHNWILSVIVHNRKVICIDINHIIFPDFISVLLQRLLEVKPLPLIITIQYATQVWAHHSKQNIIHIFKNEINAHSVRIAQIFKEPEYIPKNDLFNMYISITKGSMLLKLYAMNPTNSLQPRYQQEPFRRYTPPKLEEKGLQTDPTSESMFSFEQHVGDMVRGFLKMHIHMKEMRQRPSNFIKKYIYAERKQNDKVLKIHQDMEKIVHRPQEVSLYLRIVPSKYFGAEFLNAETQTHEVTVAEDLLEILDETELYLIEDTIEAVIMLALSKIIYMQKKINVCKQETEGEKQQNLRLHSEHQAYDKMISKMAKYLSRGHYHRESESGVYFSLNENK